MGVSNRVFTPMGALDFVALKVDIFAFQGFQPVLVKFVLEEKTTCH